MCKSKGYTLVEVMVVVSIIAILAAVAFPAYQDFTIRSRVSELAVIAAGPKGVVAESIINNGGDLPLNACSAVTVAVPSAARNTASVACDASTGSITVTGTDLARNTALTYIPTAHSSAAISVTWLCVGGGSDSKYYPSECR